MKQGLYIIYDSKAEDSSPVFQAKTEAVALRQFTTVIQKSAYAQDMILYRIANIDFISENPLEMVVEGNVKLVGTAENVLQADFTEGQGELL